MSSVTALILLAAAASPAPPAAGLSAEQALANYRALIKGAVAGPVDADCPPAPDGGITVCGRSTRAVPRLPMPDERGEPGDRPLSHPGEPASAIGALSAPTNAPGAGNRLGETLSKGFGLLRSIFTGEDPID